MGSGVAGRWIVANAVEVDYEDGTEVFRADMFTYPWACLEFKEDGSGSLFDGEGKADAFTYVATAESLVLKYTQGNDTTTYRIQELTESRLCVQEEHFEAYDGVVHKELIEINLHK